MLSQWPVFVGISLLVILATPVRGQSPSGFLNIDCGKPENEFHSENGLNYTSDSAYISAGEIFIVDPAFAPLNFPSSAQDLRSFPSGSRNCYNLKPVKQGGKYLVRCSFLYGNYDGVNKPPEFQIHIGVNYCDTLVAKTDYFYREYVAVATSDSSLLCLINNGKGTPYISSIEVRPLPDDYYSDMLSASQAFRLLQRLNLGGSTVYRYPDDKLDRIWELYPTPDCIPINVASNVTSTMGFQPPAVVMTTAYTPSNLGSSILVKFGPTTASFSLFISMHFAELQQLNSNQTRVMDVILNDKNSLSQNIRPVHLKTTTDTRYIRSPAIYKAINLLIAQDDISTLPPIINAVELFRVLKFSNLETDDSDAAAMLEIKGAFKITRNWNGDPCSPTTYMWDGLGCIYDNSTNDNSRPRIISLNLSSSGLMGEIPEAIGNLTQLAYLDLSMNKLTGGIPNFLGRLQKLTTLDIRGNNISGPIPESLQARLRAGSLTLLMGYFETKSRTKKTSSMTIIILATVCSVLITAAAAVLLWLQWKRWRNNVSGQTNMKDRGETQPKSPRNPIHSEIKQFTHEELVEITNDYGDLIGEGGFGSVFRGVLGDGIQVAVKILSKASSVHGAMQFQNEALLLSKVHHRNLVALIGYCNDPNHLALVYEYMDEGSLHDHLSGKATRLNSLGWKKRLEIAIGAAQGLDYLHGGCKPPIVHRDVKPNNILLNKNMEPKISDFGLCKIFENDSQSYITTTVMGTPGYLDPEYHITQMLREKSDVYSFGIVLLRLATGLPAIIKGIENVHIVDWVLKWYEKGTINEIIDKRLDGKYEINSVWKMMEIALVCASTESSARPSMSEVVIQLKDCLDLERAQHPNYLNGDPGEMASNEMAPKSEEMVSILLPR